MQETREARSIIEAAEQAALAGNYASAEELLREAALLQEASLGPLHPDLANTLNNLGVVCEINEKPIDAERCFRRALTIATTVLEPDHPFVATSRDNLRQFCEALGKQVELPTELATSPPEVAMMEAPASSSVDPSHESQSRQDPQDLRPFLWRMTLGALVVGSIGPTAMLLVVLTTGRPWLGSTMRSGPSSALARNSEGAILPAPRAPSRVAPIPLPEETTKIAGSGGPDPASADRITAASTHARPTVVRAQLCADLDQWRCDPPDRPVSPGPLFFYTQVKSTDATTVQHRWYRDNRLQRSVELRVQASPGDGYRTYSRNTMDGQSVGSWLVELRSEDGAVLHEERFSVR